MPKNQLTIKPLADAAGQPVFNLNKEPLYRLFGYIDGEKIRVRSSDLVKLEQIKKTKEDAATANSAKIEDALHVRQTHLDRAQLNDAEEATRRLVAGRTLLECVLLANRVLGDGKPVKFEDMRGKWEQQMKRRKLSEKTIYNNLKNLGHFIEFAKVTFIHEATTKLIEDFVHRPDFAPFSAVSFAARLSAFFSFCLDEKCLRENPFKIDLTELQDRARPVKEPDILTPAQCQALLTAAVNSDDMPHAVFFVIASLWCFMRTSEVERLTKENILIRRGPKGELVSVKIHARGDKLGSEWRDIPVPANVAALLVESIERGAFNRKGKIHFDNFNRQKLRERAGLSQLDKKKKIIGGVWSSNIMRHTGISYLFQETEGDIDLVTRRAGNSAKVAFMHYLRHAEPDAFKHFNAVTAVFLPAKNGIAQETTQAEACA